MSRMESAWTFACGDRRENGLDRCSVGDAGSVSRLRTCDVSSIQCQAVVELSVEVRWAELVDTWFEVMESCAFELDRLD